MSSSFFDIVVVGTDLSGLVMAAVVAKRGYRVLVIGQGRKGEAYEIDGIPLPRRPHLFHGLTDCPVAERLLVELGLNIELRNRSGPLTPRFQFVTPRHRLDIDNDPRVLERELQREFPAETAAIERYMRHVALDNARLQAVMESHPPLLPTGFRERRALRRATSDIQDMLGEGDASAFDHYLGHFRDGSAARAMLAAPLPFMAQPDLATMPSTTWVRAAVHATQGFHSLQGGSDHLRATLIDRVVGHCGSYRPEATAQSVNISRGRVRALFLSPRDEEVGCRLVVANSDPKRFFQTVPHESQKARFHHALHSLQPSHYLATLNLVVEGPTVQEGMGALVFSVNDPAQPLEGENLLAVTTDDRVHARRDGSPCRVVSAACRVPARQFSPRVEQARRIQERMERHVARLIPFFDERAVVRHLTWMPRDPALAELDMGEVIPLYSCTTPGSLNGSPLDSQSGYKNVLVGGDMLFAGFGYEGVFLAGDALIHRATKAIVLKSTLHD